MELEWFPIEEFPNYSVSNYGDIVNDSTGRLLRLSVTLQGAVKVNLLRDRETFTRSVKVLVAEAFVGGIFRERNSEKFNTPIHLDGDQRNCRSDNLAWRSRSFAWNYTRQFSLITSEHHLGPIEDLDNGEIYDDLFSAAITNGLLVHDLYRAVPMKLEVPPTQQRFGFLK